MRKRQWDDHKHAEKTTLRILDEIAWGYNKAKCWRWCQTVMCGGSIMSCCYRSPHGLERVPKEQNNCSLKVMEFFSCGRERGLTVKIANSCISWKFYAEFSYFTLLKW